MRPLPLPIVLLALVSCGQPARRDKTPDGENPPDHSAAGSDGSADVGDTGDTGAGEAEDTSGIDSCDWPDIGICFEFVDYDDTEGWCEAIGAMYGVSVRYLPDPCATDWVGACALPAEGDLPVESIAYYYPPGFDPASAEATCMSAGGAPI
jgi:hypothetical protein